MANLKRNMIELVKEVKGDEVITETYWTPPFIPMSVVYEAIDLLDENEEIKTEKQRLDILTEFVAKNIYKDAFTKEQLQDGLHAPDAAQTLMEQVAFIAQGQQSDATKNFLAKND